MKNMLGSMTCLMKKFERFAINQERFSSQEMNNNKDL